MPDSRTVLFLGINYDPEMTGNAPYTSSLAAGLAARGAQVHAEVAHPHYPEWRIREGYGEWTRRETVDGVSVVRRRHYVPQRPRGIWRLLSEMSFGVRLLFARWGQRDVTVAVSPALFSTWLASFRRGRAPFVVWVQDLYTLGLVETGEGSRLAMRLTRWIESRTLRKADRVVVIHERFRDYVVDVLGVDARRVAVIRNWTHLTPSGPADRRAARAALGWPEDEIVALHAGNMGAKQALENVVEAARVADDRQESVRFVLLGGGGERTRLLQLAADVERIDFIDPLPDVEFRAALASADVLLLNEKPGVAEMAVPSKLTSYFDAGRPVVAATSAGGIAAAELRAAGAGVVVAAGEPVALLDAVVSLGNDPARADHFGRAGRRYREDALDKDLAIARWVAVFDNLVVSDEQPVPPPAAA